MENVLTKKNYRPAGSFLAVLEGLLLGSFIGLLQEIIVAPLLYVISGYYTVLRAKRGSGLLFITGIASGLTVFLAYKGLDISGAFDSGFKAAVVALAALAAYHIISGSFYFATYRRHWGAWAVTLAVAMIMGLLVTVIRPNWLIIMVLPVFAAGMCPLWCAYLRTFHVLLMVAAYLGFINLIFVTGLWGSSELSIITGEGTFWWATLLFAFVPEFSTWIFPERQHKLDSLPVITPTLSPWQKIIGLKEVLLLAVAFYGMHMEKYPWFKKLAPLGRYLLLLAMVLEIYPLMGAGYPQMPLWYTVIPAVIGIMFELGVGNHGAAALWTAGYAISMGSCRGIMASGFNAGALILAAALLIITLILWYDRPRETREQKEKWIKLNRFVG